MTTKHVKRSKTWNVSLWIAQILLAGVFLMLGIMKTATPVAELSKIIPLAAEVPVLIRIIGVSELAGGVGLLLPAALRIWPQLTVFAAAALALLMVLAMLFHVARGEASSIGTNIVLGLMAGFIVWGRLQKAKIIPRSATGHAVLKTLEHEK